eukprot:CAMPEP_0171783472 /NCGR_PEP_ID=MMETSP0991-20121206/61506_1 /TAXON_ID=483369 /ORGANISM="non described non described, Strain CCMP2098" /LENGTH=44 /DNA_ID= /DNA_START= /DNA_END= /DNA_ORIENTATION=
MEDLSLKPENIKPEKLRRLPLACNPESKAIVEHLKSDKTMPAEK